MSVYCHRITELKTKDGWVNCGEVCDNYHGFNQYNNEDYYGRGLPADTCVDISGYKRNDGHDGYYCYGMSYMSLQELAAWVEREKLEAMDNIKSEFTCSMLQQIADKLNGKEAEVKDADDYHDVILSNNYYHEVFEEYFQTYDGLLSECITAQTLAEHKYEEITGESWGLHAEDVRITFFFD